MLVCEAPAKTGPNAGKPAKGTVGGWRRHYRAGEIPCTDCRVAFNAYSRQWVNDNKERRAGIDRRWYEGHRGQALANARRFRVTHPDYQRQWYTANRDHRLAVGRKWVEANRQRVADYQRRWSQENPLKRAEYGRRWRQANPDKVSEFARRRRARIAAASIIPFTDAQLLARMAYWGFQCWMCQGPFEAVDHVKPLAKGGPHILANLRPSCNRCNGRKSARWNGVEGVAS